MLISLPGAAIYAARLFFEKWCEKSYKDVMPIIQNRFRHNIFRDIPEIWPEIIANDLQNWVDKRGYCRTSRGSHLNKSYIPQSSGNFILLIK